MNELLAWMLIAPAAYLVGSIPVGLIVCRVWGGVDPREHGSGSMGATNVLRTVGKKAAVLVFVFDFGKGAAMIGLSLLLAPRSEIAPRLDGHVCDRRSHLADLRRIQGWQRDFNRMGSDSCSLSDRRRGHAGRFGDRYRYAVCVAGVDDRGLARRAGAYRPFDC